MVFTLGTSVGCLDFSGLVTDERLSFKDKATIKIYLCAWFVYDWLLNHSWMNTRHLSKNSVRWSREGQVDNLKPYNYIFFRSLNVV